MGQIGRPLGTEAGYWRPQPDNQIEVMLAHPTGIVEIYLGEITGTRIEMATDVVARTATAKEVTAGHRLYGLAGTDLAYAYDLAAVGQGLQPHLSAQLKRVTPPELRRAPERAREAQRGVRGSPPEKAVSPGDSRTRLARGPTGLGWPARGLGVCQGLAGRRPVRRADRKAAS